MRLGCEVVATAYAPLCGHMLCYAMLRYATLCYATAIAPLCGHMLCCATLRYATANAPRAFAGRASGRSTSYSRADTCRYAMPCHAMPCHAMPCYAMLCYAMPCHAMLCYAMLCGHVQLARVLRPTDLDTDIAASDSFRIADTPVTRPEPSRAHTCMHAARVASSHRARA